MKNVEIKCPLPDRAALEARLVALGARREWSRRQRDTFFSVPAGWLKLREEESVPAVLIAYARATDDAGPRPSDYDLVEVPDASAMRALLERSVGVRGVVEKTRTLWLWRHTRVHLDEVADLGAFLELETVARDIHLAAARAEADEAIAGLALERATFLAVPYLELLEARHTEVRAGLGAGSPRPTP